MARNKYPEVTVEKILVWLNGSFWKKDMTIQLFKIL